MSSIMRVLVQHGALEPKRSGPARAMDPEEAHRIKLEQQAIAKKLRKERIREAIQKGEPIPVFKQGRPQKYTPEEAMEVKRVQNRVCWHVYKQRLKDGLTRFADMVVA